MSSSTPAATSKVSFTIRRPTPVSRQSSSGVDSDRESSFKIPALPRHVTENGRTTPTSPLANGDSRNNSGRSSRNSARSKGNYAELDSSDEEEVVVDEIVTGFDQFGVQRLIEKKKENPLVIPALKNRDWREISRKRKAAELFVPGGGAATKGPDGSVGGLGTRDSINSGPQLVGLLTTEKKVKLENNNVEMKEIVTEKEIVSSTLVEKKEETEDEKALKAILRSADPNATNEENEGLIIDVSGNDTTWTKPKDETDAYRQDVLTRPDVATLEDYARVPVAEFGAALLRGMGWKPGMAASRTRQGPVEPYLPTARPALLGIGAKERVVEDDGTKTNSRGSKNTTVKRPEKRYVPVVRRERTRDGDGNDDERMSKPSSRRASMSPDRERKSDRRGEKDRDRDDKGRDRDKYRDIDKDSYLDQNKDRRYDSRRTDRDSNYERERERDRRYDKGYEDSRSRNGREDRDSRR